MNSKNTKSKITEILHVTSKKVSCDGGNVDMGHPKVYLNMGSENYVICPYCSKLFTTIKNLDTDSVVN
ncbi:MAG: zinc-finger domain-containing protein [Rickettsiales bacterium]|nr:zinc-finger domain-containing protein [Rickettsiales bacterium]